MWQDRESARVVLIAASLLMFFQRWANAEVNNIATFTFDGTTINTTAWQTFTSGGASISQNDRLIFSVPSSAYADITTRAVQVGIGGGARVDFTPMAVPDGQSFGKAYLVLTTNSAGASDSIFHDSYFAGFEVGFSPSSIDFDTSVWWQPPLSNGEVGYGRNFFSINSDRMNQTFSIQINRTGPTDAAFMVFDDQGVLLKSINFGISNSSGATPSDLYVALAGYGSVTFDNLAVGALVPEPSTTASLLGCVFLGFRFRKR